MNKHLKTAIGKLIAPIFILALVVVGACGYYNVQREMSARSNATVLQNVRPKPEHNPPYFKRPDGAIQFVIKLSGLREYLDYHKLDLMAYQPIGSQDYVLVIALHQELRHISLVPDRSQLPPSEDDESIL